MLFRQCDIHITLKKKDLCSLALRLGGPSSFLQPVKHGEVILCILRLGHKLLLSHLSHDTLTESPDTIIEEYWLS